MNYTYTLAGVAVTPLGDWQIEHRRNKGQIFWRRYLTGDLYFQDADYDFIRTQTECTELEFIIYCDGAEFWTGKFSYPYSFKFDTDQCWASGTPDLVDEYSCIMDNYETEYALFASSFPLTIELRTCAGNLLENFGWTFGLREYLDILIKDTLHTHLDCGLDLVSSFMWRDEFPGYPAGHYASIFGTNNYVTGAGNRLEYIYLKENTSLRVLLGGTACSDQNSKWSFRDFEGLLRDRFNAYWYIDSNGDFRIEHISYFLPGFAYSNYCTVNIDLTILSYKGKTYAERHNKYEYLIEELFDQERWTWQHYLGTEATVAHGTDFEGRPIYYGAAEGDKYECVPGEFKEKEIATPYFWSDIYWAHLLVAAGTVDDIQCPKGFCIWDINIATNYIRCETGYYSGLNQINGHCSTANLQAHYFTWDRIFLTGHMNNGATPPAVEITAFDSAIRKKLQEEIEFPLCCTTEFDPMDCVTTEMGDGAVYSAIQTQYSIQIQLLYD